MAETLSGVNGKIIQWAREYYNMSYEEAAQRIGVDVDKYKNWENGTDYPTYAKLRKISDAFHKPSALFFFPVPPQIKSPKGDLRTLPDTVVNRLSRNVILQLEKAKVYQLSLIELYGERDSVFLHRNEFPDGVDALCDFFRKKLEFPIAAQKARKSTKVVFEIYREKFYDIGIYVFKDSFKDNAISGLCVKDNRFPVIVINNSMSFARQIFTLFHELYHLISDTSGAEIIRDDFFSMLDEGQSDIERNCDSFANSFLVPLADFKQELKKSPIDEKRIEELAQLYSVSREAIMYKLLTMGKITNNDYSQLKEVFYGEAIRTQGKKEGKTSLVAAMLKRGMSPEDIKKYSGVSDEFRQYFSGKISGVKAGEMLQSKVDHLPRLESAFFRGVT